MEGRGYEGEFEMSWLAISCIGSLDIDNRSARKKEGWGFCSCYEHFCWTLLRFAVMMIVEV